MLLLMCNSASHRNGEFNNMKILHTFPLESFSFISLSTSLPLRPQGFEGI